MPGEVGAKMTETRMARSAAPAEQGLHRPALLRAIALGHAVEARVRAGEHAGDCLLGFYAFPYLVSPPPTGLGLPVLFQQSLQDTSFCGFQSARETRGEWSYAALRCSPSIPTLQLGFCRPTHPSRR